MYRQYLTLHTEYMEVPSSKKDIGIHTGLYIHNHILHLSSLALFSLLALLN